MSYQSFKKRTYEILEKGTPDDKWSHRVDVFIISLILLNILAVVLESVLAIRENYQQVFNYFEIFSVIIFSIEYLFRIWSITENKKYQNPISGRLRYLFSFYSLIDLVAILPAYIPFFIGLDTRVVRGIRILRLFRILKLSRYNKAFSHLKQVIQSTKEQLAISLFAVLMLLVISSTLMYYVENEAQPEAFSSIPATMWWGVATLTTVGYGDVYPITETGKLMAGVIAILGVGLFALPAGILANGFGSNLEHKEEKNHNDERPCFCKHCGKKIIED
ncbi:ion transporter [Kordia sp. YSTF-M3]|uniref:Ion transporter n=1 Tax=Kordia aestuariivivens TaxID=2759037 RepID=A0ABR7Q680_9FLAO|nr:ion transporter [Kordia aestuariivivens]MBC8754070.1 ion transporter [Kordia aestuariivivens]